MPMLDIKELGESTEIREKATLLCEKDAGLGQQREIHFFRVE